MKTVFALATARGRAGLAVVRISGPDAVVASHSFLKTVPKARGLRSVFDGNGQLIDEALVLFFPKGKSFTGEDVVELHLHGSSAIVKEVLRVLGEHPKLEHAAPGEFTRRALENGRLDLAQVEGLADLIDAETDSQRRQAMRVFAGALGALAEGWRSRLIRAAALLEATIDFVDEEVPVDVAPEVIDLLKTVMVEMDHEAKGVGVAERLRDGFEVAIVGEPNVGKSTLLNKLAGREVAITSDIAGTTRDVIEVQLDLDGLPVTILDTAGLRDTDDHIEGLGVARAKERARAADIRLHLLIREEIPDHNLETGDLYMIGKADVPKVGVAGISGRTGAGIEDLVDLISSILAKRVATIGVAMRERHRTALIDSMQYLTSAVGGLESGQMFTDLIAEDLRSAIRAVDSLVGRVDVEHVLDEIFSSFCIGK